MGFVGDKGGGGGGNNWSFKMYNPGARMRPKDDGGAGDLWSYKTCKAPVKLSPPTNQHPAFYRPDAEQTVSYQNHTNCVEFSTVPDACQLS